jgi:hypothetical protein
MARAPFRPPSGSTLIEVMMAAAVLVIGLGGIIGMMLNISTSTRVGVGQMNGASIASSMIQQTTGVGYCNLVPGNSDGGVTDGAGRVYNAFVGVTSIGGAVEPAYRVDVQVHWTDAQRTPHISSASTLVSRPPDAGC